MHDAANRVRNYEGGSHPVLSVYLGVRPGEQRSVPARLKDLLAPLKNDSTWSHDGAMSIRADVESIIGMADRIAADAGHGVAVFQSTGGGLSEYLTLPARVRDRAVIDRSPYTRPLDAVMERIYRYLVVLIDRRQAVLHEMYLDEIAEVEVLEEEEIRKANYGGFAGYSEQRTRSHADAVLARHYRDSAEAIRLRAAPYDRLVVCGVRDHVDGLVSALHPDALKKYCGSFVVDVGTVTPAIMRQRAVEVADAYDAEVERSAVQRLLDTAAAGGPATVGVKATLNAVNQRAVDQLLVEAARSVPGSRCADCGWLALDGRGLCSACGENLEPVPDLYDAMSESVRTAGGRVRNILIETPLADDEVGAMLRFPLRVAIS